MADKSDRASLLKARHLTIFRERDHQLIVRSGARLGYSLLAVVLVALCAFAVWLCTMVFLAAWNIVGEQPHRWPELWTGGVCVAFFAVGEIAFLYLLLRLATPEWTRFDVQEGTAVRWRILLPRRHVLLANVSSLDLVMVGDNQTRSCFLALTTDNVQGLWVFHWLGGYQRAEVYRDELIPVAKLVAAFLGKPIYASYGRLRKMNWCKGEQREQIM